MSSERSLTFCHSHLTRFNSRCALAFLMIYLQAGTTKFPPRSLDPSSTPCMLPFHAFLLIHACLLLTLPDFLHIGMDCSWVWRTWSLKKKINQHSWTSLFARTITPWDFSKQIPEGYDFFFGFSGTAIVWKPVITSWHKHKKKINSSIAYYRVKN